MKRSRSKITSVAFRSLPPGKRKRAMCSFFSALAYNTLGLLSKHAKLKSLAPLRYSYNIMKNGRLKYWMLAEMRF